MVKQSHDYGQKDNPKNTVRECAIESVDKKVIDEELFALIQMENN